MINNKLSGISNLISKRIKIGIQLETIFVFQMFPMAIVCGNTYIMKPSEQDPACCMLLSKLAQDSGVPDGVLNVIHGTKPGLHCFSGYTSTFFFNDELKCSIIQIHLFHKYNLID